MAKEDATEQIKEFLRQLIKYRFWISIGFAALFALIAYFLGSGPVNASANKERDNIIKVEKGVKAYQVPSKPTEKYKPIVDEKTQIVEKDVTKAWRELYNRQAPLLNWPGSVQERFRKWGRKWPEDEDKGRVRVAIVDYIYAYPAYVDLVYKTVDPFDYETGKGVVAAPPKEVLLQPAQFTIESMPSLGKVWAAQERLWIQRTVLDVIRQVNKKATSWDNAIVRQVDQLVVANQAAQDQKSMANGETLTKAPDILAPGQQSEEEAAAAATSGGGGTASGGMAGGGMGGRAMMESMMAGRRGMTGMGGGGTVAAGDDSIYFIDQGKSKILPISITVLIDQDHVQDLLVELENSPMSIQVMDFELEKPSSRVTKPEKGEQPGGMSGMGMGSMSMMMGMGRMRGMMGGQMGFGGMASQMRNQMGMQMGSMMARGGMERMMGGRGGMGMPGMGGMGTGREERKKVDTSNVNRKEEREKTAKELEERRGPVVLDPYFNIVQLTVYGQARFFEAPPVEPPAEPSLGEAPASPGATDTAGAATKTAPPAAEKAAPPAAEKAAPPAVEKKGAPAPAGADEKAAKAQPGQAPAPSKPAAEGKPAAPPAPTDAAKPATKAEPAKN
jgi:hypothetical protein